MSFFTNFPNKYAYPYNRKILPKLYKNKPCPIRQQKQFISASCGKVFRRGVRVTQK